MMMRVHDCSAPMNEITVWMRAVDEHADHRAEHVAAAAGQQRAADHDRGDRVELGSDAVTAGSRRPSTR